MSKKKTSPKVQPREPDPIGKAICELFLAWEEMAREKDAKTTATDRSMERDNASDSLET